MKKYAVLFAAILITISIVSCQKEATGENPVTASFALGKNNTHPLPFEGEYTTSAHILTGPPMLQQEITGEGHASHLGKSSFVALSTLNLTTAPPFSLGGTATFTAANGDEFYTTFTGTATPNNEGGNVVVMQHTITSGTGRFANATGSFEGMTVAYPGHTEGSITYQGTIR